MSAILHPYSDADDAAEACAHHILGVLAEALAGQEFATLAISGGSTPKLMFQKMVPMQFAWNRVHLFFVDERCVEPTSNESNFKLANESLIIPAHVPRQQVHRIVGELSPQHAAERYVSDIQEHFALEAGALPHFDVIHQGMGSDAHTASLFPGSPLIDDREGIAATAYSESQGTWRVTLLPGVLLAAKHNVLLVSGVDKAQAVHNVFEADYDPKKYPAQIVTHHGRKVAWFLDIGAVSLVKAQ